MPPSIETFAIPELLEMILENARHQDLLVWQRVSKTWQAVIQDSPRIQEKLHFRSPPCKNKHEQKSVVWNPLIEFFPCILGAHSFVITRKTPGEEACYPTASWKRMFVTSPAITEMKPKLIFGLGHHVLRQRNVKPIVCETGVTIGHIADALKWELHQKPLLGLSPYSSLSSQFFVKLELQSAT